MIPLFTLIVHCCLMNPRRVRHLGAKVPQVWGGGGKPMRAVMGAIMGALAPYAASLLAKAAA